MDEKGRRHLSVDEAMQMAIREAHRGAPFVSPNPLVGCVILDYEGRFLKSGYHKNFGGPHAEVNALAGLHHDQLEGAHVIVTLEPCAHEGKTPSCAKTLAKLPVKKITYGLVDPNPLVAGQGAQILTAAGKEVVLYTGLKKELEKVCEIFLLNQRQKKIFVALKVATSLDGLMAMKSGESKWITGGASRLKTHELRAAFDAILVGAGTVEKDDPSLNIRHPEIHKINKVVVIDPQGTLLKDYHKLKISKSNEGVNVFWCVLESVRVAEIHGPHVLRIKGTANQMDLVNLLDQLWDQKVRSVFIEGGSYTYTQFLKAGLVNRVYNFQAPHLMGAGHGLSWTQNLQISLMKDRIHLEDLECEKIGDDLLISARLPGPLPNT